MKVFCMPQQNNIALLLLLLLLLVVACFSSESSGALGTPGDEMAAGSLVDTAADVDVIGGIETYEDEDEEGSSESDCIIVASPEPCTPALASSSSGMAGQHISTIVWSSVAASSYDQWLQTYTKLPVAQYTGYLKMRAVKHVLYLQEYASALPPQYSAGAGTGGGRGHGDVSGRHRYAHAAAASGGGGVGAGREAQTNVFHELHFVSDAGEKFSAYHGYSTGGGSGSGSGGGVGRDRDRGGRGAGGGAGPSQARDILNRASGRSGFGAGSTGDGVGRGSGSSSDGRPSSGRHLQDASIRGDINLDTYAQKIVQNVSFSAGWPLYSPLYSPRPGDFVVITQHRTTSFSKWISFMTTGSAGLMADPGVGGDGYNPTAAGAVGNGRVVERWARVPGGVQSMLAGVVHDRLGQSVTLLTFFPASEASAGGKEEVPVAVRFAAWYKDLVNNGLAKFFKSNARSFALAPCTSSVYVIRGSGSAEPMGATDGGGASLRSDDGCDSAGRSTSGMTDCGSSHNAAWIAAMKPV